MSQRGECMAVFRALALAGVCLALGSVTGSASDPGWHDGRGISQGRDGPRRLGRRRPSRRDPTRVRARIPGGVDGRVASSSRPTSARASMASGRKPSPSPGASLTTSRRVTGPRVSPCRGGASWPRSTGGRGEAGRFPWIEPAGHRAISAARRRWPRPSSPRRGRPTAQGWTEVSDTYQAPSRATQAIVELHLRWAPDSEVRWSGVSLTETSPRRRGRCGWRPSTSGPAAARRRRTTAGCTSRSSPRRPAEGRPGRARRDAHLRRPGQVVPRRRRTDPRPVHRIFRPAGEAAQPLHRARPARARRRTWSTTSRC